MGERPWLKWYPADWRSEPRLRMCSRAARSLWLDLIGLMHEAEPYGHLLVNGINPNTKQLSAILGDSERELKALIGELEAAGVFTRTEEGVITSRRMIRDKKKADEDAKNGRGGGNPRVKGGVNPTVKPEDNGWVKAQRPEARGHDLKPTHGALSRGRQAAAQSQAAAPPVAPSDWADEFPEWAEFKAKLEPSEWNVWFSSIRPNGSTASLVARSPFELEQLSERYLPRLVAHFGEDFQLKVKP